MLTGLALQWEAGLCLPPATGSLSALSCWVTGYQTGVIDSSSPQPPSQNSSFPGAALYNLKHFITGQFGFPAHFKWPCWGSPTLSSPHWSILTVTSTAFPCYSARPGLAVNYHIARPFHWEKCRHSKVRTNCEQHFFPTSQDPHQRRS